MASNRHLGRIVALQTLYEYEFRTQSEDTKLDLNEVLGRNIERYQEAIDDKEFVSELVKGVIEHMNAVSYTHLTLPTKRIV